MQHPLLRRFAIFYLLLSICLFIGANTICCIYTKNIMIENKQTQLSVYSEQIKNQYFSMAMSQNTIYTPTNIAQKISELDHILDTETWITDSYGNLRINSGNISYLSNSVCVLNYDGNYFSTYYHIDKQLDVLQTEHTLSVILPVANDLQIEGYIIVHTPMSNINAQLNSFRFYINVLCIVVTLLLGVALFFTWVTAIRPAKETLWYLTENNKGNYVIIPDASAKDEFGKIKLEVNYATEKLQNLDDYQKNFIANVSHDFRSPLTSIKGYATAMVDGTIPPELHNKYLDVISFEVERLTKLTSDLLSLNQYEQGKHKLNITSFDINKTIKQTAASFEGTCIEKHIKLQLIFSEEYTMVNADYAKIQQVLYNLLDNAIKFSHNDSKIIIKSIEKKEKVQISIKDFGIGIPKEGIKQIWDRFYKTDISRGKDKKGTGLGLSIVKEILKSHDENINVTSTEGAGTEFTFTLPLSSPHE